MFNQTKSFKISSDSQAALFSQTCSGPSTTVQLQSTATRSTDMVATGVAKRNPAASTTTAKQTDAEKKLRFIEEVTADVDAVQERVLADILARNAETEYLARCGLAGATDRATFRAKVPMVTYDGTRTCSLTSGGSSTATAHPSCRRVLSPSSSPSPAPARRAASASSCLSSTMCSTAASSCIASSCQS